MAVWDHPGFTGGGNWGKFELEQWQARSAFWVSPQAVPLVILEPHSVHRTLQGRTRRNLESHCWSRRYNWAAELGRRDLSWKSVFVSVLGRPGGAHHIPCVMSAHKALPVGANLAELNYLQVSAWVSLLTSQRWVSSFLRRGGGEMPLTPWDICQVGLREGGCCGI